MEKGFIKQRAHDIFIAEGQGDRGHYFHGNSMLPVFREADYLMLKQIGWENLRVGNVVVFRDELRYPTRRIVKKYSDAVLVVGDNWIDQKQLINSERILGVVYSRRREKRTITSNDIEWKFHMYICLMRFRLLSLPGLTAHLARKITKSIRRRFTALWN
jgi:hypothetical protein